MVLYDPNKEQVIILERFEIVSLKASFEDYCANGEFKQIFKTENESVP